MFSLVFIGSFDEGLAGWGFVKGLVELGELLQLLQRVTHWASKVPKHQVLGFRAWANARNLIKIDEGRVDTPEILQPYT